MYSRMCSLMLKHNFIEQINVMEIADKQLKKRVGMKVEKKIDETIHKCMNGVGCQYKDGCALRMNENVKKIIRKEIKKCGSGSDEKRD